MTRAWTVNSDKTVAWVSAGQYITPALLNSPKSGTITITDYGNGQQVMIEGRSIIRARYSALDNVTEEGCGLHRTKSDKKEKQQISSVFVGVFVYL